MPGLVCFLSIEEYCIDSTDALLGIILVILWEGYLSHLSSCWGINAMSLDRKWRLELHAHKLQSEMWRNVSVVLGACGPGRDSDGGQSRKKDFGRNLFFFFNRQLLGFCLQTLCRTAVKHKNQRFWSLQACQSWWSRWRQGEGQHLPHALIEYRNCQRSYEKEGGPWRQQTRAGQSVVGFKAQVERVNGQNPYRVTTRWHGTRQVECSTHIVGLEIRRLQWRHPR